METFLYRVKTKSGETVKGSLRAESLFAALKDLSHRGYFPLDVRKKEAGDAEPDIFPWSNNVSLKALALFTRQLADLIEAGLPLPRALEIARNQTVHPRLRKTVEDMRLLVRGGKSLHEAIGEFPEIFSSLYVGLVRAGEMGGALGSALLSLADYQERREEFRARIRAALAYPLLVAVVGVGTVAFLMAVVVPKLSAMFSDMGQALPLPTKLLVQACDYAVSYGWMTALGTVGITALAFSRRSGNGESLDRMFLRIPLFGSLARRIAMARFAHTMEILLTGGVPLLEALQIAADVMGNKILRAQTLDAAVHVRRGVSFAESLKACPEFPPLLAQMVAIGEEGNTVEKALGRVAMIYERESDRAMKTILSLVEPALILTVGGAVGTIVVAMLLPIFQIPVFVR